MKGDEYPVLAFASQAAFRDWLAAEHARVPGIWLKLARKGTGVASVTYAEAVDVALCYGWIDGQARRSADEGCYEQRFTPRRARSKWSKINREKVAALIERGEMRPAGQAEIDRAKADGRWDAAYDSPRTATVPDDLQAALEAAGPAAVQFFSGLTSGQRYSILHQLHDARRPETRSRRIDKYVAMMARGEKPG